MIFKQTQEEKQIVDMIWKSDCSYRKCVGENPERVFLSKQAIMQLAPESIVITANGETDIMVNEMDVYYDPMLQGNACYCRVEMDF